MTTDQKLSIEDAWARLRPIVIARRALSSRDEAIEAARAYGLAVLEAAIMTQGWDENSSAGREADLRAQIEGLS